MCLWYTVTAKCVMRGECAMVGGFAKLCPVDEEAPPVLDADSLTDETRVEVLNIIKSRCPELLYDEDGKEKNEADIVSCCDVVQIREMDRNLLMAEGVIGRCPICVRNFARQVCELNCSPNQSKFATVRVEYTPDGTAFVNEVNYTVYEKFMIDAHASCAGIIVPQTGMPAINLMCGNAPVCTPEAWLGFTGDTETNPLAPVQVNFIKSPTPENSMNAHAPLCNETLEGDLPCSCVDCHANCPMSERPQAPDICHVLSFNCIGFSVGLVFFALSVIMFTVLAFLECRQLKTSSKIEEKYEFNNINRVTKIFQKVFSAIGVFSASNPVLTIMVTTWIAFAMLFGVAQLNLTANPMELWSGPESRSRQEFNYFNSRFGPFYRAAQVFLTFKGLDSFVVNNVTYGPAFRVEAIHELVALENAIIDIGREDDTVKLENICYAPLRVPGGEQKLNQCVQMSVSTYLPDRKINNDTYLRSIQDCLNNHLALNCLADWGGGAEPEISVGGYDGDNILEAHTLLINFPIRNFLRAEDLVPVLEWEQKFINLMHEYEKNNKSDFVDVAFGTERSIEDEIQRISVAEALPITISYLLMFVYVIFALGNIRRFKTCLIDSKVTVAISCIIVVLISIFCAMGILGYMDGTVTLLAINVIPFFILSVGIDNVFLMINEMQEVEMNLEKYEDYKDNFSFEKKKRFIFGKMMNNIGPSMFVSSITQITCFAIGSITNLPAVKSFAIFASCSLVFLFLFQITAVIGILSIDYNRVKTNRFDLICCIQKKILNDEEPLQDGKAYQSITKRLMVPYSKFILDWRVKITVAIIFMFLVSGSVIIIPQIEVGLDQEMALPPDSYVYKYLTSVNQLMRLGPPVYFVLKDGLNFTNPDHQNVICGSRLCNDDSLVTQLFLASRHSDATYIARSSNSWIDDFFDWASLPNACCKYNTTDGGFCASMDNSPECSFCTIERSELANGLRPAGSAFRNYVPFFLQDTPTAVCSRGGLGSYFSNVNFLLDSEGTATVQDTNFMTYHTTLATSQDFIAALSNAYDISADITTAIQKHTNLDVEVFPYSVFYVFFEQYLSMWGDTFASLGYCLVGVLAINLLVTGFNFLITSALVITVIMVVVEMMGVMYLWNIPLNPVSCINLIVSIGISVEFCSHIAYAYATSVCEPSEKVRDAIRNVGSTIITGITLTNIPIIVLYFSYTQIIEVFFFRMLFSLVILGFIHGMIFFPVLLSYMNDLKYR
ncbi:NPC intracellular cholesterol transporter 1 homolog 1b-like [Maniola jurtina]|uniref:NPC intracellular cholesterol transporter 1 homolog 1b-like n=1 Tax=Maniola jurtina TaxID=191418 RepID=UPI001E68A32F|nr:NPC intracellular cholesterol transporter 1 homolog 1b-like [Maniola jurtina]